MNYFYIYEGIFSHHHLKKESALSDMLEMQYESVTPWIFWKEWSVGLIWFQIFLWLKLKMQIPVVMLCWLVRG